MEERSAPVHPARPVIRGSTPPQRRSTTTLSSPRLKLLQYVGILRISGWRLSYVRSFWDNNSPVSRRKRLRVNDIF